MPVKGTSNNGQSAYVSKSDEVNQGASLKPEGLESDRLSVKRAQRSVDTSGDKRKKITDRVMSNHTAYDDARDKIERFFMGALESQPSKRRVSFFSDLSEDEIKKNLPDIDTSDAGNSTDLAMSSKFEQYHQELDKLKLDLGGSPNYLGKRPKLRRGNKLFGLSIDTVRAWVSKALKKKWFPRPLFRQLFPMFIRRRSLNN